MKRVAGMTIIELLLRRLCHSKMIDVIVVRHLKTRKSVFEQITLRILVLYMQLEVKLMY